MKRDGPPSGAHREQSTPPEGVDAGSGAASGRAGFGLSSLRSSQALRRTFSSLEQTSFRNLWIGMLLQMGAMQIQMMIRGYYIYELTGSATLLGVVIAAFTLPTLPLALFGGVLADRIEKKRIIQMGQATSAFLALFIALSITTDIITWQYLLVASVVHGAILALVMPARQAIIPLVVGKERLMNAVALNSMGMSVATIAAPALAGGLVTVVGVDGVYYLMVGMYAGAILFTSFLPRLEEGSGESGRRMRTELAEGFRYLRANRAILLLLALGFSQLILVMPFRFVLPVFAKDVFFVGPQGLGLMMSAMGFGSLGGALLMASLGKVGGRGLMLCVSGLLSGMVLLGFSAMSSLAPVFWAALVFLALSGLMQSGRMTLQQSLTMEYTEQRYRGRVMGISILGFGLMPAGVLPLTLMAESVGAPLAMGIIAMLFIFVVGGIIVFGPSLRKLA